MLRVPSIASNLASVHKICHDNNCCCYFDEHTLSIQALATGKILYQGRSEDGVYPIYPHKATALLSNKVCNSAKSSSSTWSAKFSSSTWSLWHSRLDHPNAHTLRLLLQNNGLSCNNSANVVNSCIHCLHGKMQRLPFPSSRYVANSPFKLVHTDLWGPAPLLRAICGKPNGKKSPMMRATGN